MQCKYNFPFIELKLIMIYEFCLCGFFQLYYITFQGDTGSPLILLTPSGAVLQGIVSWNDGCGASSAPGVFTRVASYIDWLRSAIQNN